MDPKVDIALLSWVADYPDAQSFYQLFTCGNIENGLNSPRFCDEEYDKLYNEAIETLDTEARIAAYKELEAMLSGPDGGFPVAPLFQPKDDTVIQKWVENLEYTPLGLFFLDDVKIREH
jgi:ABC-type oligopeptide transport system substrate-binding subunit